MGYHPGREGGLQTGESKMVPFSRFIIADYHTTCTILQCRACVLYMLCMHFHVLKYVMLNYPYKIVILIIHINSDFFFSDLYVKYDLGMFS